MNILLSLLVSSVYIFNAQGQYLCIGEDGTPMLSDAPVSLEVTRVDEVADAGRIDLDYTGMKWILKPSAEHTYTLGYQVGEANATTFVYVRSGAMATTFEEPDATFLDGQWAVSTGEESQPVFLDETADYVCPQFYKQHVDITLQRSLVQQEWNTLCLPFSLHADRVRALWGEGTRVAEYTGDTGDKLLFTTCEDIEAGVPYVLKPERVSEDNVYRVEGIDITSWDRGNRSRETVADGTRFIGFYGPTIVPANAYVFGDGDRMYCLETDMGANGFRGYFQSNDPADCRSQPRLDCRGSGGHLRPADRTRGLSPCRWRRLQRWRPTGAPQGFCRASCPWPVYRQWYQNHRQISLTQ